MKIPKVKTLKHIAMGLGVVIVALLCALIFVPASDKGNNISKKSYTTSPDGHVQITNPAEGAAIASPVLVSGSVMGGGWFFEGVFPVKIVDADGTVLGSGQAEAAQGEWASTGTVLFSGIVSFSVPHSTTGRIVFSKDNPSGLPQNNGSFSVPVRFQ